MGNLAITGGEVLRKTPFTRCPEVDKSDEESRNDKGRGLIYKA